MIATKFTAARELCSCELPTFQEIFGRRLPASHGYARPISQHVANSKRNYRASPAAALDLPCRGGIAKRQSGCGSTGCAILKKRNAAQGEAVGILRSGNACSPNSREGFSTTLATTPIPLASWQCLSRKPDHYWVAPRLATGLGPLTLQPAEILTIDVLPPCQCNGIAHELLVPSR